MNTKRNRRRMGTEGLKKLKWKGTLRRTRCALKYYKPRLRNVVYGNYKNKPNGTFRIGKKVISLG